MDIATLFTVGISITLRHEACRDFNTEWCTELREHPWLLQVRFLQMNRSIARGSGANTT
jgi:hypothetical protein